MTKTDVPLQHMAYIVSTCIMQHNMCTIIKEKFDRESIEEAKEN